VSITIADKQMILMFSVPAQCSLCLCGERLAELIHHRGTENTEIAQRGPQTKEIAN